MILVYYHYIYNIYKYHYKIDTFTHSLYNQYVTKTNQINTTSPLPSAASANIYIYLFCGVSPGGAALTAERMKGIPMTVERLKSAYSSL